MFPEITSSTTEWLQEKGGTNPKSSRKHLAAPAMSVKNHSEGSVVSFADDPIPATTRDRRRGEALLLGPSVSVGPAQGSSSMSAPRDLVGAFDSFSFVDAVLQDPDRTSTSLANAAIRLRATMSSDDGILSTLTMVAGERKRTMEKLLTRILVEADRLDADESGEVEIERGELEEIEMEEAGPAGNASGSRDGKGVREKEQE